MGWYHTGPRLREADIDINQLIARYCDNPLLIICEVQVRPGEWAGPGAGTIWLLGSGSRDGYIQGWGINQGPSASMLRP